MHVRVGFVALSFFVTATCAQANDWLTWRGPSLNGVADSGQQPVTQWSANQNVIWKTPVPGRGHSSPIVVGDRIFLQTADERAQVQSVVAFDRASGKQVWKTDINRGGFPARIHNKNTHASPTIACNGKTLFASFFHHGGIELTSLGLDGKINWKRNVGPFTPRAYQYGYAPSPALYKNLVIVAADYDGGGYLAAFDQATGRPRWKTARPGKISYSSPIIANVAGRDQLLISGCEIVASYDPLTGRKNWQAAGTTMATCGTMVWDGNIVFASGGYPKAETIAVDARTGRVLWRNRAKCYEQSMLASDGFLYGVTDNGIGYCWEAASGREMWKTRMAGPISASPILANGNIYQSNERGTTWVFKASGNRYQQVARNQLGAESFATPTIVDSVIYLRVADRANGRRQEYLYAIGN